MSESRAPRDGLILAINAGSSSLKISLFRRAYHTSEHGKPNDVVDLLLVSSITNISSPPTKFTFSLVSHSQGREAKKEPIDKVHDHASAFAHFLDYLKKESAIDRSAVVHVCHRVVHGGDYFEPVIIDSDSYHHIEKLSDLAPLSYIRV